MMRKVKVRGVTVQVSENFYRMMERARIDYQIKTKQKIGSHKELTEMWSRQRFPQINKRVIRRRK